MEIPYYDQNQLQGAVMKTDNYTKFILTVIALGLFINAGVDLIEPAQAKDHGSLRPYHLPVNSNVRLSHSEALIIEQILYCIDQSIIEGTYMQDTYRLQMQQCEWKYPWKPRKNII